MDMSGAALGNLTATQRDQLMSEVKQQLAVANAQELLTVNKNGFFGPLLSTSNKCVCIFHSQKITEKCFKKCVNKPGTSLGSSEQVNLYSNSFVSTIQTSLYVSLWTEMHSDVYGSFHGLLEFDFTRIHAKNTKRAGRWRLLNGIGAPRKLLRSKFHRNTHLVSHALIAIQIDSKPNITRNKKQKYVLEN